MAFQHSQAFDRLSTELCRRINNSNFAIHPQRISAGGLSACCLSAFSHRTAKIRNLPTFVDANKLREAIVKPLG